MERQGRGSSDVVSIDTLRDEVLGELDLLVESAATLRGELRGFEVAIKKARRYLEKGGAAGNMRSVVDIGAAREQLSQVAEKFQTHRHKARLAVFRMQIAEGLSVGAIAREWGLSRQLVSRMLKETPAEQASEN